MINNNIDIPAELMARAKTLNLPLDGEINRKQFAELGGVTLNKLHYAVKYNRDIVWPKNVGNLTRHRFKTVDVLAFLSQTPLAELKVEWNPSRKEARPVRTRFDHDNTAAFLRGDYAPAHEYRQHLRLKMAARKQRPGTQTVKIRGGDLWLSGRSWEAP